MEFKIGKGVVKFPKIGDCDVELVEFWHEKAERLPAKIVKNNTKHMFDFWIIKSTLYKLYLKNCNFI